MEQELSYADAMRLLGEREWVGRFAWGSGKIVWMADHYSGDPDDVKDQMWDDYCEVVDEIRGVLPGRWVIKGYWSDNDSQGFTLVKGEEVEQRAEYRTQEAGVSDYVTWDDLEGLQQQVEELSKEVYTRAGDRDAELTVWATQVIGMCPYGGEPLVDEIWRKVARRLLRVMDETWTVEQSE